MTIRNVPNEWNLPRFRIGYNLLMPRAALIALLIAFTLDGSLQAQRATPTFHGRPVVGLPVRSGFVGQRGFSNRFSSRSHLGHNSFGSFFIPYDEPFGYEQPEAVTEGTLPPALILQHDERQYREPEPTAPKALVIEIPGAASSTAAKMLPPTIFILANGERLEARRFVLTASKLSLSIDRQQRTVPIDMLDVNATITFNHERGIDLRVPDDRNEISLSF